MTVIHPRYYLLEELFLANAHMDCSARTHARMHSCTRRVRVTYCFGYRLQLVLAGFKATAVLFPPLSSHFAKLSVEYVTLSRLLFFHPSLSSAVWVGGGWGGGFAPY